MYRDNRQHPTIHRAFSELWGREDLWVSIDDMEWKPPVSPDHHAGWGQPLQLHCDVSEDSLRSGLGMQPPTDAEMAQPTGLRVQGMLYLNDCGPHDGAWRCVPGFHTNFDRWVSAQPKGQLNFALLEADPTWRIDNVSARSGDFVIWHSYLPHGNSLHTGTRPRIGQPITMWPCGLQHWPTYRTTGYGHRDGVKGCPPHLTAHSAPPNEEERHRRVMMWRERLPGGCYNWPPIEPPDSRAEPQRRPSEPAKLTALGRKLLGIDSW